MRPDAPERWAVQPAGPIPGAIAFLDGIALTTRLGVLALAPFVASGAARRLALFAVGSIAYFIGISVLAECTIIRYRLPAVPFIALAAALGLDALRKRFAREAGPPRGSERQGEHSARGPRAP